MNGVGREVEVDLVDEGSRPESHSSRGGGYQRAVGQLQRDGRLTDVIDRIYRSHRTDGEPIDRHAVARGSSRLCVHKTIVVSYIRGGSVTDAVGDQFEAEGVAGVEPGVEPRRGLKHDASFSPACHPNRQTRAGPRRTRVASDGAHRRVRGRMSSLSHLHSAFVGLGVS
jgi:hypothetical protein